MPWLVSAIDAIQIDSILPLHEVRDEQKLNTLADDMRNNGWTGYPLLGIDNGEYIQAITGSHRYEAAKLAGLDEIPMHIIDATLHRYDESQTSGCTQCKNMDACWVNALLEATDDEVRLDILSESPDKEAFELMHNEY